MNFKSKTDDEKILVKKSVRCLDHINMTKFMKSHCCLRARGRRFVSKGKIWGHLSDAAVQVRKGVQCGHGQEVSLLIHKLKDSSTLIHSFSAP